MSLGDVVVTGALGGVSRSLKKHLKVLSLEQSIVHQFSSRKKCCLEQQEFYCIIYSQGLGWTPKHTCLGYVEVSPSFHMPIEVEIIVKFYNSYIFNAAILNTLTR